MQIRTVSNTSLSAGANVVAFNEGALPSAVYSVSYVLSVGSETLATNPNQISLKTTTGFTITVPENCTLSDCFIVHTGTGEIDESVLPVTLAEVKQYLNLVNDTTHDAFLTAWLAIVTDSVEKHLNSVIKARTFNNLIHSGEGYDELETVKKPVIRLANRALSDVQVKEDFDQTAETANPDEDIEQGSFAIDPVSIPGTPFYQVLADSSDTSYISTTAASDSCEIGLGAINHPVVCSYVYRASFDTDTTVLRVHLYQGDTLIHTGTDNAGTEYASPTNFTETLSDDEVNSITDPSDLSLVFVVETTSEPKFYKAYLSATTEDWNNLLTTNVGQIFIDPNRPYKVTLREDVFPLGDGNIKMNLICGYDPVPDEIKRVVIEMVAQAYYESRHGEKRLGVSSFSQTQTGMSGTTAFFRLTNEHEQALRKYRYIHA